LKAKIGLVVVSASTISELRYPRAAPPGVGFFTSRMLLGEDQGLQGLIEMETNAVRAVQELASARMDSIAYCCTVSGAMRGLEQDRAFCDGMEAQWGIPTTSTMLAAAEAMQHLGLRQVVVTSPYPESHHEAERAYLAEAGITAVAMEGMGLHTAAEFAAVSPGEICRFSLGAWNSYRDASDGDASGGEADGIFISCMNFDAMAAAQDLEDAIGKPVVTSHSATLWRALSLAGVPDPVPGYGRLLAEERQITQQPQEVRP
jgi:maleate isomerase